MAIIIAFSLISSISASELSDNDINQNNIDNNINTIALEEENENIEISSVNFENIDDEISENKLNDANPNPIYVSTSGNDLTGDGSENNPYKTIKQGIDNSDNESTIYLDEGNYDGLNFTVGKTLTIEGKKDKTIIDGKNASRIFIMNSSAKLTLIGLTLINGNMGSNETGYGGSIYNNGGELTLINCTIKDSYAGLNGGAIFNNMGKLTIIGCDVINNSAVQYGGAIYSSGITDIQESYFTENHVLAEKGVGGTIACGGTASLNNTLFLNNYANYAAGALLSLGDATINNCRFINQSTEYTAGAISNHGHMIINNSQFIKCYAQFYASAILAYDTSNQIFTEVYNTIFEKNHVTNHAAVSNNFNDAELKMENCALIDNYIWNMGHMYYGDVALDKNASMLYCWWGQNDVGNYYSPHNDDWEAYKINASRWLLVNFTANYGTILEDKENILKVDLHRYFDNETKEIYSYDEYINLPLTVKFTTNAGKTIANVVLENGTAILNYIPEPDVAYVYAELNNQRMRIDVTKKDPSQLIVEDFSKMCNESDKLEVRLTDGDNNPLANKNITLKIGDDIFTNETDENGLIQFEINLPVGVYYAELVFKDEVYKNQNKTVQITILSNKTKTKFKFNNLVRYCNESKSIEIQLLDVDDNPLAYKTITIKIGEDNYTRETNDGGFAFLDLDYAPGIYFADVMFKDDDIYEDFNRTIRINILDNETADVITPENSNNANNSTNGSANGNDNKASTAKLKTTIVAKDLIKYYKNYTKLTVKLADSNKKTVASRKVKINIGGKNYYKTTNSKGIAIFSINQKVGKYNVKISFGGDKNYASSTKTIKAYVKSAKIAIKNKKVHRNSNLLVLFKDKDGKAIKKTKVKFKLNGKTFTKTTNSKGIAKLKINVKIGTYKIKTSFKSTKIYGATVFTNKIKVIK